MTATLAVWGKALARIQTQARDAGTPSAIPDFIGGYFQRAVATGLGQEEAIAIYMVLLSGDQPASGNRGENVRRGEEGVWRH